MNRRKLLALLWQAPVAAACGVKVCADPVQETHTLLTSEMPSHSHSIVDPGHTHSMIQPVTGITLGSDRNAWQWW